MPMRIVGALLHQRGALLLRGGDLRTWAADRPPAACPARGRPACARDLDEVRVRLLDLVEIALDAAHLVDVFDRALFAGRDDQPLRAFFERNLGLRRRLVVGGDRGWS